MMVCLCVRDTRMCMHACKFMCPPFNHGCMYIGLCNCVHFCVHSCIHVCVPWSIKYDSWVAIVAALDLDWFPWQDKPVIEYTPH